MPNTPSKGGTAVGKQRRPRGQADSSPQTRSNTSTLATTGREGIYRRRFPTRGPGGRPRGRTGYLVTARKKTSKPRRTLDIKVLNKHAVCETHHTQFAFY